MLRYPNILTGRFTPRPAPLRPHRALQTCAIMNGWQYQSRADALRARGLDVHEFGTRILRESSFGEDVLSLQAFLSQEGYYNPLDGGYTGYFGTVTKEALQAWQRDIGLEPTGVFDASARWAYLRQLEARQASEIATHSSFQAENFVIATAQPAVASHPLTQMQPPVNAGFPFFFAAAVLSGIALTRLLPSMMRGRFSNGGYFASGDQTTDAGMQPTMFQAPSQGNAAAHVQSDGLIDEVSALTSTLRRLSNDELQRYIAPMKGAVSSRTPLQRPAPRQLELSDVDGAVGHPTKYGSSIYYGGITVRERVKSFLSEQDPTAAAPGGAAERMAAMGYDMRRGRRPSAKTSASPAAPSMPPTQPKAQSRNQWQQQQQQQESQLGTPSAAVLMQGRNMVKTFEDLPSGNAHSIEATYDDGFSTTAAAAAAPTALLSGTDLEAAPERPLRPVAVVRPGVPASPVVKGASDYDAPHAAIAPVQTTARPVKVVKPGHRTEATVEGDAANSATARPVDPNATVVMVDKPIKLHKPARLASRSYSSDSDGDAY